MNLNSIFDDNYKYQIIDELTFDNKCLSCDNDGSKYKKYILVCYKENNIIKYTTVPNESYLDKLTNVINIYNVEEIISSCSNFDSMYNELTYFHMNDLYFIKYLMDEENFKASKLNNDYEMIIEKLRI